MGIGDGDPLERIGSYTGAYRRPLGFPRRLGFLSAVVLTILGLAFVARLGTTEARVSAGVGMVLSVVLAVWFSRRLARRWAQPDQALHLALRRHDREHAARAARALSTVRRLRGEGETKTNESAELADLHLNRVLDGVSVEKIAQTGSRARKIALRFVVPLTAACMALLWARPLMILEGVDVLLAQDGKGPFPIAYITSLTVTAEMPSYLDGSGQKRAISSRLTAVPRGSQIEVRVTPRVPDRKLLLTDGMEEVPLVSDGQGGLVARWEAEAPSNLRIAAKFGDVLLFDGQETLLSPLEDHAPRVRLSGAPARKKLEDIDGLELDYFVLDDHGITQVDLVVESGQRVHREELARLDGQKKAYRGAHRLPSNHDMLERAFLPVRVRIEARDGNTATGPSWGKSQSYVLLPKPLGQEVAQRHGQLRGFRRALTKYLARDLEASHATIVEARQMREAAWSELRAAFDELERQLSKSVDVPQHSLAFFEAQLEALTREGAERSSSEAVVLAADALLHDIAFKEARNLSRDLGAAVEEIAVQARELRFNADGVSARGLSDLVEGAKLGGAQLREVGELGLDLGSVARGDLARIETSLDKKEYDRAEVAALHLAERLKRATPSFGSKGGAGVESGMPQSGGSGEGHGDGPASEAPEQFQELSQEVDSLAQETAEELSELERMLRDARRAAEADFEASDELESATDELRRALEGLPENSAGPGGPRAEAAAARGHGEAMAEAMDARDLLEAVERGLDAQGALKRAEQLLQQRRGWLSAESLERATEALDRALQEAKRAAEQLQRERGEKMGDSLQERAERQRQFAERARELAKRGRQPEAPLPHDSIEALRRAARLMDQAAQEMDAGRGEEGAEQATEAQAELERALPQPPESEEQDGSGHQAGGEGAMSRDGSVPEEEKDRAKDFRERVEKGLGRGAGRLSPAVRRYAEELK